MRATGRQGSDGRAGANTVAAKVQHSSSPGNGSPSAFSGMTPRRGVARVKDSAAVDPLLDISAISSLSTDSTSGSVDHSGDGGGHLGSDTASHYDAVDSYDEDEHDIPRQGTPKPLVKPCLPRRPEEAVAAPPITRSTTPTATTRSLAVSATAFAPRATAGRDPTPSRRISGESARHPRAPAAAVSTVQGLRASSRGRAAPAIDAPASRPPSRGSISGGVRTGDALSTHEGGKQSVRGGAHGTWRGTAGRVRVPPTIGIEPWAAHLRDPSPLPEDARGSVVVKPFGISFSASSAMRTRPGGVIPTAGLAAAPVEKPVGEYATRVSRPASAGRARHIGAGSADLAALASVPRSSSTLKGGRVISSTTELAGIALERADDQYLRAKSFLRTYYTLKQNGEIKDVETESKILLGIKDMYELSGSFVSIAHKARGFIPHEEPETNNTVLLKYLQDSLSAEPPGSRASSAARSRPSSAR